MNIHDIRKLANREIIDYPFLLHALSEYTRPRDKISVWLKSGELIRVKKGLYIFGKDVALAPYSSELLANLIYGPSAISLSYALAFYGIIPERVTTLTSITNKRNKQFSTPVGNFVYRYLSPAKYAIGIELITRENSSSFLIASPEKALCDYLLLSDHHLLLANINDMHHYLLRDLRIDEPALRSFKINKLRAIAQLYANTKLDLLITFMKKWK